MVLAYRCAYCSQWNPALKPRPQLAISYDKNELTHNNRSSSTETIEDISDEVSLKNHSDNKNENSDPKDNLLTSKIDIKRLLMFCLTWIFF